MWLKEKVVLLETDSNNTLISDRTDLILSDNNELYNPFKNQYYQLYLVSKDIINDNEFDILLKQGLFFKSLNSTIKVITKYRVKTPGTYRKIISKITSPVTLQSYIESYIECVSKCVSKNNIFDVVAMLEYEQTYEDVLEGSEFVLRPTGFRLLVDNIKFYLD